MEKYNVDELIFFGKKLFCIFLMIYNFTIAITRIHFTVCKVGIDILKISYSCMENITTTINNHNLRVLNEEKSASKRTFNCRNKNKCPLNGQCLHQNII